MELLHSLRTNTSLAEVCHPNGLAFDGIEKVVFEEVIGKLIENEHTFSIALEFLLLIGQLPFVNLDPVLTCQLAQGFAIAELFYFHDEMNR